MRTAKAQGFIESPKAAEIIIGIVKSISGTTVTLLTLSWGQIQSFSIQFMTSFSRLSFIESGPIKNLSPMKTIGTHSSSTQ